MSAFIVSHACIDAIVTYAIDNRINYRVGDITCICDPRDATKLGKLLLLENERSVQHRYPGSDNADLPGRVGERARNYKFTRDDRPNVRMECECYDYQACETDDYEQSVAYQIIHAILERTNDR